MSVFRKKSKVCKNCTAENCDYCDDVWAVVLGQDPHCKCKLPHHSGEPKNRQVLDPLTGTVWAPGLSISPEGEVKKT